MVRVTSIKKCKTDDYDDIYLIVRSISSLQKSKSKLLDKAVQVEDLSPSKSLFYDYLNWSKAGEWNKEKFESDYKPVFLNEISNNINAQNWLNKIETDSKAGRRIALLCFCTDEDLCHRSIIGEILRSRGCEVIFDKDTD